MDIMLAPFLRYADFHGRSRRLEYWVFALINLAVLGTFSAMFLSALNTGESPANILAAAVFWVMLTIVPHIAVTVRRLHDANFSGWLWFLIFIPYVGGLVLTVFMLIDGTRGPNRFGEDPKDRAAGYEPTHPAPNDVRQQGSFGRGTAIGTASARRLEELNREAWLKRLEGR